MRIRVTEIVTRLETPEGISTQQSATVKFWSLRVCRPRITQSLLAK